MLRIFLTFFVLFVASSLHAQPLSVAEANKGRVGIMTGSAIGTYIKVGGDLSAVLDGKNGLRIVPMVGKGTEQNIRDLIVFYHTDLALVQSDVLELIRRERPDGIERNRLAYIAKIYDEEIHLVASTASNIRTVGDLRGKRVNIGSRGSGSRITSEILLSFFELPVNRSELSNSDAIRALLEGKIDAMIFVEKKPADIISKVRDKSKIMVVPIELTEPMEEVYARASFSEDDYPGVVVGKGLETIAVPAILAVYNNFAKNGQRYQNLTKFSRELVANIGVLQQKEPKRWASTDLREKVPGWPRYEPMQDAINNTASENKQPPEEDGTIFPSNSPLSED